MINDNNSQHNKFISSILQRNCLHIWERYKIMHKHTNNKIFISSQLIHTNEFSDDAIRTYTWKKDKQIFH